VKALYEKQSQTHPNKTYDVQEIRM